MKRVLSIVLMIVNSITFIVGLGFLFGDDQEDIKAFK